MLHAELRNKAGEGVSRLEDVLTSSVFGTIFTAGADKLLGAWFRKARKPSGELLALDDAIVDWYWFWPRLSSDGVDVTEPDLLIRIGSLLLIVEAKYRSHESSEDQLSREWRACLAARPAYNAEVGREIDGADRRVLIYLVSRKSVGRARPFVERSLVEVADADMYLLTWEDLDDVLRVEATVPRWWRELRDFLEARRIAAFRGFGAALTDIDWSLVQQLANFSAQPQALIQPNQVAGISKLATWTPHFARQEAP